MFWKEVTRRLKIKRALTMAHHPQADGQTEIMNQILETALRSYVIPELNAWSSYLELFSLAYNSTPHSETSFTPAFLLYRFNPQTGTILLQNQVR